MPFPEKRDMAAPRILMPLLFAACIFIVTGMRLRSVNPSRFATLIPARLLWQLVSAMVETETVLGLDGKLDLYPKHL